MRVLWRIIATYRNDDRRHDTHLPFSPHLAFLSRCIHVLTFVLSSSRLLRCQIGFPNSLRLGDRIVGFGVVVPHYRLHKTSAMPLSRYAHHTVELCGENDVLRWAVRFRGVLWCLDLDLGPLFSARFPLWRLWRSSSSGNPFSVL